MRFLLSLIIWTVIVGGLFLYTSSRDAAVSRITAAVPVELDVEGNFTLEITPTFSTEKDPFALQVDDSDQQPLEVRLNGQKISLPEEEIVRGKTLRIENISGILKGYNEVYVKASPPLDESELDHGVRLHILQDEKSLASDTIWSGQGALVSGSLNFSYGDAKEESHDH